MNDAEKLQKLIEEAPDSTLAVILRMQMTALSSLKNGSGTELSHEELTIVEKIVALGERAAAKLEQGSGIQPDN